MQARELQSADVRLRVQYLDLGTMINKLECHMILSPKSYNIGARQMHMLMTLKWQILNNVWSTWDVQNIGPDCNNQFIRSQYPSNKAR